MFKTCVQFVYNFFDLFSAQCYANKGLVSIDAPKNSTIFLYNTRLPNSTLTHTIKEKPYYNFALDKLQAYCITFVIKHPLPSRLKCLEITFPL